MREAAPPEVRGGINKWVQWFWIYLAQKLVLDPALDPALEQAMKAAREMALRLVVVLMVITTEPTLPTPPPAPALQQPAALAPVSASPEALIVPGGWQIGGIPPPSRNQRPPTGEDTPYNTAASSLDSPRAIAFQNRCCSALPATRGRPGERIAGRPARSDRLRFRFSIAAPHHRGVATTS